jgi:hypothetical protein
VHRAAAWLPGRLRFGWAVLLVWLLTTIMLIVVTLTLSHGRSAGPCTTFWTAACAASAPGHSARPAVHETVTSQASHQGSAGA